MSIFHLLQICIHSFFFLHLCSSVWMQPTRNWCSYSAVSQHSLTQTLRQHCWPCFYDRLLFSEIARAEQQINCTHVMVDILLCFTVTPSHCECWCDWILVFLLYFVFQLHPSRVCTRAVLQLFDKTDVGMVSEVFWQEACCAAAPGAQCTCLFMTPDQSSGGSNSSSIFNEKSPSRGYKNQAMAFPLSLL